MFLIIIFALLFYAIYDLRKTKINSGKHFLFERDGYKARVIVDDSVPVVNKTFISTGDEKVTGEEVAIACHVAMMAVINILSIKNRQIRENGSYSISPCYFVFLGKKKFDDVAKKNGYSDPSMINVLSSLIKTKHLFGLWTKETPVIFLRSNHMHQIIKNGGIVLHELVHVTCLNIYDHWDVNHTLWDSVEYKQRRKTLDRILKDEWDKLFKTKYK